MPSNINKHAYAGQLNSLTPLRAHLVLQDRGVFWPRQLASPRQIPTTIVATITSTRDAFNGISQRTAPALALAASSTVAIMDCSVFILAGFVPIRVQFGRVFHRLILGCLKAQVTFA
jgi:hypothetical protein